MSHDTGSLTLRVSSNFIGSLYRGKRVSCSHSLHRYTSTLPAPQALSSSVGSDIPWCAMLAPRAPQKRQGGLFVHLKKSLLNQLGRDKTQRAYSSDPDERAGWLDHEESVSGIHATIVRADARRHAFPKR